jgi:hypothetical protein
MCYPISNISVNIIIQKGVISVKAATKTWLYFGIAIFLVVGYPAILMMISETVPLYLFLPSLIGIGMIVGRGTAIWVDLVSHKSEHTKDLDYPDPTIIDTTGIKYREEYKDDRSR